MLNILVTDAVWTVDRIEIQKFYLVVSVNDSTALTELAQIGDYTASVTTSVSVLDSPTAIIVSFFMQEEASKLPVYELTASFTRVFTSSNPKLPVRSGLGYSGASLSEKRIPLRTISAHVADPAVSLYGGANKLPTYTASGFFGMRLAEYIPLRTLSASFDLAGVFSLDKAIPVRTLSATFKYPDSFTLSRQIPIWIGQGSLVLSTYPSTLDARIPGAFLFTGSLRDITGYVLDGYIPVRKLDSSMYCGDMWLAEKIPIWMMGGSSNTDIGAGSGMSYHNRFTDYVLRYIRP